MSSEKPTSDPAIILFDGDCNLCNAAVRFITSHDKNHVFRCYSRRTPKGMKWVERCGLDADQIDSVVLIEGDRVSVRSTASLRIARRLAWPWPIFYAGIIVPAVVRDFFYGIISRNRRRWFGQTEACSLPDRK
jgi:predicted DCC family thiol-disulfide oxidoreductase YuxK